MIFQPLYNKLIKLIIMIKVQATIVGKVKRGALLRTDKDGKNYLSYVVHVNVPAGDKKNKVMEIIMSDHDSSSSYKEGGRILANGTLDIRKKGEDYSFYLSAEKVTDKEVPAVDAVKGELHFRGRLKNEDVCETKEDKGGKPYLLFPAYSSEKSGDTFVSTWVRFLYFPPKDAAVDVLQPEWMKPKGRFTATGSFEVSVYNDEFRFSSVVKEMEEYVYEGNG